MAARMQSDTKPVPVDADDLIDQVRGNLFNQAPGDEHASAVQFYSGPVPRWKPVLPGSGDSAGIAGHLQKLRLSFVQEIEPGIERIGEMPSYTATFRARCGRVAIRFLQRLLWWYTSPLRLFAGAVWKHLQEELLVLEQLAHAQQSAQRDLAALQEEVRQLRARLETGSQPR